jgi:hypothetical protein
MERKYCRPIFWLALLFFTILFLVPAPYLPEDALFHWWDKAQHALVFAILMTLGGIAYPEKMIKVGLGLLLYGANIEALQSLTSWRRGDLLYWYADAMGVILIWILGEIYMAIS